MKIRNGDCSERHEDKERDGHDRVGRGCKLLIKKCKKSLDLGSDRSYARRGRLQEVGVSLYRYLPWRHLTSWRLVLPVITVYGAIFPQFPAFALPDPSRYFLLKGDSMTHWFFKKPMLCVTIGLMIVAMTAPGMGTGNPRAHQYHRFRSTKGRRGRRRPGARRSGDQRSAQGCDAERRHLQLHQPPGWEVPVDGFQPGIPQHAL